MIRTLLIANDESLITDFNNNWHVQELHCRFHFPMGQTCTFWSLYRSNQNWTKKYMSFILLLLYTLIGPHSPKCDRFVDLDVDSKNSVPPFSIHYELHEIATFYSSISLSKYILISRIGFLDVLWTCVSETWGAVLMKNMHY